MKIKTKFIQVMQQSKIKISIPIHTSLSGKVINAKLNLGLKIFKINKLIAAGPADQSPTVKLSKYLIQVSNK